MVKLEQAIQTLNPEDKILFNYRYKDKLSFIAIGILFGIDNDAASKRYYRTLPKLRKALLHLGIDKTVFEV